MTCGLVILTDFIRKADLPKTKDDEIKDLGKVALRKTRKASFKIENRSGTGTISPESLARYEQWKKIGEDSY